MARLSKTRLLLSFFRFSLTKILIISNVIVFFLFLIISSFFDISSYVFLTPALVAKGYMWTLLTSMFLHAGAFHLFINMFSLFFLGELVERIIGRKRLFWIYFIGGIVASIFFVVFAYIGAYVPRGDFLFGTISTPAVGASGAIFALVGLLAVLIPRKQVYLIVGPLILIILEFAFIGVFPSSAQGIITIFVNVLLFMMIFSIFSSNRFLRSVAIPLRLPFWAVPFVAILPLFVIGFFVRLPFGNTGHLGGLIAGLIYGSYLRTKYSRKVRMLNRAFA